MNHLQRIGFQRHLHLGQSAPGAADGVEALAPELIRDGLQHPVDAGLDTIGVEPLAVGQREGPQRQGQAMFNTVPVQPRQLQTGAAHVG